MSGRRDAFGKFLSDLEPIEVRLRGMHLHSYTAHASYLKPLFGGKGRQLLEERQCKGDQGLVLLCPKVCCSSGKSPNTRAPRSPATQRDAP